MPIVTPTPVPPLVGDLPDPSDRTTYGQRGRAMWLWETGVMVPGLNTLAQQTLGNAQHAELMAAAAQAMINFLGPWSDLPATPISPPASVSHNGDFYLLLATLADPTASEPGVSADWGVFQFDSAADVTFDPAATGLPATNVQQAIDQLAARNNLCDNPYFDAYTRTVVPPAVSDALTFAPGEFIRDRWKAGAGGFTRQGLSSQPINLSLQIATGTVVHQMLGQFFTGETITVAWDGTAQARINGGTYAASPIVHTFASAVTNPSIEWSGNGTSLTAVRIHRGPVDLGCDPFHWYVPGLRLDYFAKFYRRVSFARQWTASAGEVDRTVVSISPMVVQPVPTTLSTSQNINVTSMIADMLSNSELRVSVTANAAGATRRESLIALDTGF